MTKWKVWIGNYDGSREALVIATSQKVACKIAGCGIASFREYYHELPFKVAEYRGLQTNRLYTKPMWGAGFQEVPWTQGLCELKKR